ncbi:hypothetical protein ACQ4PT_046752 [Festuca glaucescens]
MDTLLSAAQWMVGKALASVADGVLEAWDASKNFGLNIEALRTELLLVQATLEAASRKKIGGKAMEELLGKLRHSAHGAEDLLDELDYFRVHDELHGTYDAADQHAKGGVHDLALNARHTAKAVLGLSSAATLDEPGQANEEVVSGCMPKLGKLLPLSSSPHVHDNNSGQSTLCGSWYRCRDFPKDLSNLANLRRFYTPSDELHSEIFNVGKLVLLEELKVFRVNKESEGFEPKQLESLTELRELGIYNLENIRTKEEAAKTKLTEKSNLKRLTLDWDIKRCNIDPYVEAVILESLQPNRYLLELCIRVRGHGGPSCPTWLGDNLSVEALQSLHLVGVSWQCLPSLGKMWGLDTLKLYNIVPMKELVIEESFDRLIRLELVGLASFEKWLPSQDAHMFPLLQVLIIRGCPKLLELAFSNHIVYSPNEDWNIGWFPKLQELEIYNCPEFLLVVHMPWTETLCSVKIRGVKLLEKLYSKLSYRLELEIFGKDDLQSLDQILAFSNLMGLEKLALKKCPSLDSKHLLMLASLKTLAIENSDGLVGSLEGEGDVEWQLPIEILMVEELRGASGKELTELLTHLPRLSKLDIRNCTSITHLAMGVDVQQTMLAATSEVGEEDRLLVLPAHLYGTLQDLVISLCPELVLVEPSTFLPYRGFQALRSLQTLEIQHSPKLLSRCSFSGCLFPSSLQELVLQGVEGMGTLEPLSNLTSLTRLDLWYCGEDLRCKGLGPLLTTGGQLRKLLVYGSPRFFADPTQVLLQEDEGGEEHQLVSLAAVCSCKLQDFSTDDVVGFLTCLQLYQNFNYKVERFTNEQEDALHLLVSLQQLEFREYNKLQHLPAGMHKLTNLKRLEAPALEVV